MNETELKLVCCILYQN